MVELVDSGTDRKSEGQNVQRVWMDMNNKKFIYLYL